MIIPNDDKDSEKWNHSYIGDESVKWKTTLENSFRVPFKTRNELST